MSETSSRNGVRCSACVWYRALHRRAHQQGCTLPVGVAAAGRSMRLFALSCSHLPSYDGLPAIDQVGIAFRDQTVHNGTIELGNRLLVFVARMGHVVTKTAVVMFQVIVIPLLIGDIWHGRVFVVIVVLGPNRIIASLTHPLTSAFLREHR